MIKALGWALATALLGIAAPAAAQDPIKIGLIVDRIGFAKAWSEPITQGAVYAARELNAKGGVLGRKVELVIEDDQSKPDLSATAARKLEEAGAAFILSLTAHGGRAAGADRDGGDQDAAPRALAHRRYAHHAGAEPELLADRPARLDADRDPALLCAPQQLQARRAGLRQLGDQPGDRQGVQGRVRQEQDRAGRGRGAALGRAVGRGADAEGARAKARRDLSSPRCSRRKTCWCCAPTASTR
jgi:hypothetical protein